MSGARALLAAILFSCAAAALGGVFAWRALRAEERLRRALYERYGPEISLLRELSMKLSRGLGARSRDDRAASYRVLAKAGVLVARIRGGSSRCTFRHDKRLSPLPGGLLEPAGDAVTVRRLALSLKNGGSLDAVAAAWKVCAGSDCEEVVCEFAVEARQFERDVKRR